VGLSVHDFPITKEEKVKACLSLLPWGNDTPHSPTTECIRDLDCTLEKWLFVSSIIASFEVVLRDNREKLAQA